MEKIKYYWVPYAQQFWAVKGDKYVKLELEYNERCGCTTDSFIVSSGNYNGLYERAKPTEDCLIAEEVWYRRMNKMIEEVNNYLTYQIQENTVNTFKAKDLVEKLKEK
ncbi:hypothetical protein ACT8O7_07880 [Ornithobacterium rhinotracheale]|uniref:hypothetical protein n=1 Tax=Ornithobacterium rhinotracheale TaxID=28251 RepID=UPI004039979C